MRLKGRIMIDDQGFTMIEVIAILIVLGIISAVALSRVVDTDAQLYGQSAILRTHIRYAQIRAINANATSGITVWGIKCDGSNYWLFRGSNPDSATNIFLFPDDTIYDTNGDRKLELSAKKVSVSTFTVFFDDRGIPYSSYTTATTNVPLTADLNITVRPSGKANPSRTIVVTPLTGFVS